MDYLVTNGLPFCLALFLSIFGTAFWIKLSKSESIGQPIREEGNKEHYKKAGTPTIGGIVFTGVAVVLLFIFKGFHWQTFFLAGASIGYGLIGFIDDYEKVTKKESEGLTPRQKLILQSVLALILSIVAYLKVPGASLQVIPLFNLSLNLGPLWIPIFAFAIVAISNAVNLTDGLDGLCTGVSLPIFFTLIIMGNMGFANAEYGSFYSMLFASALIGYLFFNSHPASIMMGDTGSMAIGGAIVAVILLYNRLLFLPIMGAVFVAETLSVIIQVAYFKKTGGKRIFKMSPIHHHFELSGYAEEKVAVAFSIVSFIFCVLTLNIL